MISIIIPWRDREELGQTIPHLVRIADGLRGQVTIVNYGGSPQLLERQLLLHHGKVQVVYIKDKQFFNKSCAQNLGAYYSVQPLLFFCDCDILAGTSTIAQLAHAVADRPDCFATLARVRETRTTSDQVHNIVCTGYRLTIRTVNGRLLSLPYWGEPGGLGMRMAPGLLLVKRKDFISINGFNSRFTGWGWESQDMISRLILGAGLKRLSRGEALHISHDDETRTRFAAVTDRWENRDRMFRQAITNYNGGDFDGTYRIDITQDPSTVDLYSYPAIS